MSDLKLSGEKERVAMTDDALNAVAPAYKARDEEKATASLVYAEAVLAAGGVSDSSAKSLLTMQREVFAWAVEKGWESDKQTFGDECALLHSEISEALEAFRDYHDLQGHYEEDGILKVADRTDYCGHKPLGVPSEFADVLIRLLHYAERHGIDLEREYEAKMVYNRVRAYRHGGKVL